MSLPKANKAFLIVDAFLFDFIHLLVS